MKIGIFFMHAPGESMGSIFRVRSLCQGLTKLSHECYIFTPFYYSEDWGPLVKFITIPFISSGKFSKNIYRFVRRFLDIKILSNYTVLNPIAFDLTLSRISNRLVEVINQESIDLDVMIGETEISGLILIKAKNKLKFPVVVDYQNYWPEELVEHKIIRRNGKRYNYLLDVENKIINNSDLVFTVSNTLKRFLRKKFPYLDENFFKTIKICALPILDKPRGKGFPPKIINSGMIVHRSNFKYFFKSIPYILDKYPDTRIYVTKKGEKLKETMKLAKKMKLNIDFYWKETYEDYIDLLSQCHVGVVTSTYELTRKLGFVTKVHDYISVGIPVVGNDIGGWSSMISKEKIGLLASEDPKDLAEKILTFIENPKMAYEYGNRGINLLNTKYNVKNAAHKLISNIESIQQQ
ncbi:MAG: glycosyltransferase [Promethearchaeota archaeon]